MIIRDIDWCISLHTLYGWTHNKSFSKLQFLGLLGC
jgi:hypothetical protein